MLIIIIIHVVLVTLPFLSMVFGEFPFYMDHILVNNVSHRLFLCLITFSDMWFLVTIPFRKGGFW